MSTNRVLLSAGGLKISKPGFNVLGSISDSQVSFDSSWPKAQRILTRGTVTVAASGSQTVYYPRALAAVPTALILAMYTSFSSSWASVGYVDGGFANADMSGQVPFMPAAVYSDRMVFRSASTTATVFSYIVLIP